VRVVADSHALVWYVRGSSRLSSRAAKSLREAEATESIVVSAATFVDLWYVAQSTRAVTADELAGLRDRAGSAIGVDVHPVDLAVVDDWMTIPRDTLPDPWDRFVVATARTLQTPLVTKDEEYASPALSRSCGDPTCGTTRRSGPIFPYDSTTIQDRERPGRGNQSVRGSDHRGSRAGTQTS
jgi:PIN domain nuclease of toxin-antitoxin system